MAKVYEFIANGTEEIECTTPIVVLRRADVEIVTVSVTGSREAVLAHDVHMTCDTTIEECDFSDADMLLLPGGLPGAYNLRDHEGVRRAVLAQAAAGKKIGALCASPLVLGSLGLLDGKRATCYPGFEAELGAAVPTGEVFTIDGNIITGCGPAAAMPYAFGVASMLVPQQKVEELKEMMMWNRVTALS